MMWFFAVLIVLLLGGIVVVASGEGASLSRVYDDRPDAAVPGGRALTGADLRAVELTTAIRGYRASEVDALLDRLAAQLDGAEPPTPFTEVVAEEVDEEPAPDQTEDADEG